ncbi:MAG: hypothetical protein ACSHX4_02380 [Opitutaceae bacterium]
MTPTPKLSFSCPMNWDAMDGNASIRFCEQCNRSVHNISEMSDSKREALLKQAKTERTCVAYYKSLNGELVTDRNTINTYKKRIASTAALATASAMLAACSTTTPSEEAKAPENTAPVVIPEIEEIEMMLGVMCVQPPMDMPVSND